MKKTLNRRILIVGEGRETEYNYFVGFRNEFENVLSTTSTAVRVARGKGGDARGIVKNAIKELKKFQPNWKLGDSVFLLLDTEGQSNIPGAGRAPELPVAERLAEDNRIEIVYSSPAFEYWLLCHFPSVRRGEFADCSAVITELEKKWSGVKKGGYDKADLDVFKRLSPYLDTARSQALTVDLQNSAKARSTRRVNPSSQVYELVANLIGAKSDEKCPLSGTWKRLGNAATVTQLNKGVKMPLYEGMAAHWFL